jgi:uncharacterized membrane protein
VKKKHISVLKAHHNQGEHIVNINDVNAEIKKGFNAAFSSLLTGIYGSIWFVYFLILATSGWMFLQSYLLKQPFDPYPFAFLLFLGNLIQLLGGPIIQVGQNASIQHSELRAESDHHIHELNFNHLTEVIQRLETIQININSLQTLMNIHTGIQSDE